MDEKYARVSINIKFILNALINLETAKSNLGPFLASETFTSFLT